jgi:protein-tyrosine kinase
MNLIERAVDLLSRSPGPEANRPTPAASAPDPSAVRPVSLIESAMAQAPAVPFPRSAVLPLENKLPPKGEGQPESRPLQSAPRPRTVASHSTATSQKGRTCELPLEYLRARGFVLPDAAPNALSQEFRVIKRPLLDNAFGRGVPALERGRQIMITSALPGEGKSFCAINLALSLSAERDTHVLLVDADVAKPSVLRELGVEGTDRHASGERAGLMECLIDQHAAVDQCVLRTNIERLSILPAGRPHEHATELLASASMEALVAQLANRYDDRVIIFDSPPILMTTESRVLASHMGQIVMVVEAGKTQRDAVTEALAAIGSPQNVGILLNKSKTPATGGYGGYGYGYGYAGQ